MEFGSHALPRPVVMLAFTALVSGARVLSLLLGI